MSEWTDATSEAVAGHQMPRHADPDDYEDCGEIEAVDYPDPDDECLGPEAVDRGPEQFDEYD